MPARMSVLKERPELASLGRMPAAKLRPSLSDPLLPLGPIMLEWQFPRCSGRSSAHVGRRVIGQGRLPTNRQSASVGESSQQFERLVRSSQFR